MEVKYDDANLERLETDPEFRPRLGRDVVRAFRKCMQLIRAVPDERTLYRFSSRRFKRLEGARSHQHSLRLNDQWRLVVEIEKGSPKNVLKIIAIEDYH
jgi:proteic killer suppression protein